MNRLISCQTCGRHVRHDEPICPFCQTVLGEVEVPPAVPVEQLATLSRSARVALGMAMATMVACGGDTSEDSITPVYGAPAPDAGFEGGAGSGGGGEAGTPGTGGTGGAAGASGSAGMGAGGLMAAYGAPPFDAGPPQDSGMADDAGGGQPVYGAPMLPDGGVPEAGADGG